MEQIKIEVKDNQEQVDVCIVKYSAQTSGGIQSVQAGTDIEVDNTDPLNPIVNFDGTFFSGSYDDLTDKPTLFDGDYNSLSNNPTTITPTQAAEIAANTLKVSFPEAPVDGKQYARINGAWQEVSASLDKAYTDTVNIPAASGTVNIDFSLGIHFNITLVGNTTLTFTNYLPYKSIKVQTLQINSASSAHTLALPAGVTFITAIDLSATTKNNFLSVNILGTDLFQCANLVKTIV